MLFFDSDGVFADFAGYMLAHHFSDLEDMEQVNKLPREIHGARMKRAYISDPDVFSKLAPIPGAGCMLDAARDLGANWTILTACGTDHYSYDHVRVCKEHWFSLHHDVPKERIIVTKESADKQAYAGPGRVLVDDYYRNCEQWAAAGGFAIHCESSRPNLLEIVRLIKECHEKEYSLSPGIVSV